MVSMDSLPLLQHWLLDEHCIYLQPLLLHYLNSHWELPYVSELHQSMDRYVLVIPVSGPNQGQDLPTQASLPHCLSFWQTFQVLLLSHVTVI